MDTMLCARPPSGRPFGITLVDPPKGTWTTSHLLSQWMIHTNSVWLEGVQICELLNKRKRFAILNSWHRSYQNWLVHHRVPGSFSFFCFFAQWFPGGFKKSQLGNKFNGDVFCSFKIVFVKFECPFQSGLNSPLISEGIAKVTTR